MEFIIIQNIVFVRAKFKSEAHFVGRDMNILIILKKIIFVLWRISNNAAGFLVPGCDGSLSTPLAIDFVPRSELGTKYFFCI